MLFKDELIVPNHPRYHSPLQCPVAPRLSIAPLRLVFGYVYSRPSPDAFPRWHAHGKYVPFLRDSALRFVRNTHFLQVMMQKPKKTRVERIESRVEANSNLKNRLKRQRKREKELAAREALRKKL